MQAYKIQIAIGLTNNVSRVLGTIMGDFTKAEGAAGRLEKAMGRMKMAAGIGVASGALAFGLYEGLSKALKPAEEYTHQLAKMNNLGMKQKEIADSVGAAWKVARSIPTSNPTENLKSIVEMRQVFGGSEEAVRYLPAMEKLKAVISSVTGKEGDPAGDLSRALELRGVSQNPAEFNRQAGMMAQGIMASGGRVTDKDYLQLFRQAAPFTNRFNDEFAYRDLPTLMQDMGASKTGTAISTLGNALIGGRMTKAALGIWQKMGLIEANAGTSPSSAGGVQINNPKAIKDASLFQANPLQYVQQVLLPAMQKAGANTPDQIQGLISQMFSNRNAARIVSDFIVNNPRIVKDAALNSLPATPDAAYSQLMKNDPEMAKKVLSAQWETLMTALGKSVIPALIVGLEKLTHAVEWLTDIANRHPRLAKFAFEAAAVLTAILGVTAAVAFLAIPFIALGAPIAAVIAGITALGAILLMFPQKIEEIQQRILHPLDWSDHTDYTTDRTKAFLARRDSAAPAGGSGSWGDVHTTVNLDGKHLTTVVNKHNGRAASSPVNSGTGSYDGRMSPMPNVGGSGSW